MTDSRAIFETAFRILAIADSEDEIQTAAGLMKQSADLGYGPAAGSYGNLLMSGQGVPRDEEKAFSYWSLGALEHGDAECAFRLGTACQDGIYAPEDMAGALAWFMLARDLGLDLAALDVDNVAFHIDDFGRGQAFRRYDRLRSNCVTLR